MFMNQKLLQFWFPLYINSILILNLIVSEIFLYLHNLFKSYILALKKIQNIDLN